jgi:hypothetical protein
LGSITFIIKLRGVNEKPYINFLGERKDRVLRAWVVEPGNLLDLHLPLFGLVKIIKAFCASISSSIKIRVMIEPTYEVVVSI